MQVRVVCCSKENIKNWTEKMARSKNAFQANDAGDQTRFDKDMFSTHIQEHIIVSHPTVCFQDKKFVFFFPLLY